MPTQFNKKDVYTIKVTYSEEVLSDAQHRQLFRILNAEKEPNLVKEAVEEICDEHNSEASSVLSGIVPGTKKKRNHRAAA